MDYSLYRMGYNRLRLNFSKGWGIKMRILWLILFSINILFANSLIVKEGDVKLLINGQTIDVKKDQNLTLEEGSMVCFLSGDGKVIIDNTKQLDNKTRDCYQLPIKDNFDIDAFMSSSKNSIAVLAKENTSKSRGTKGISESSSETADLVLSQVDKEVIIYNETYGPLPVTLNIKKSDGTNVKEIVNEENIKTFFRVPATYLENNSKIEITNAFGDTLLNKQVVIQSSKLRSKSKKLPSKSNEKHSQVFYEKDNHTIVDILYGTDRKIDPKEKWEDYYTGDRDKLQFGVAQVSIPKKHKFGEMERPNKYLFWQKEKIGEHVVVVKLEDINKKEFAKFLGSKLNNVEEKDILIFIHGFNVTFASAIRRTAQLSYDLKFKGVPITYSWPSAGETSEYMKDESSVQYTTPHLVAFLKEVIDNKGDANIHIIGHSMGTRALTNAIKEISFVYPDKHVFKNIILAAPDIDKDVFEVNLFPYIRKTTDQITLYASSDDTALKLSSTLHSGKRIGQGGDEIFVFKGLVTVDATGIDTSLLGHSYFAEKELLVGDLKEVIIKSLPPAQRNFLMEKIKAKLEYWKFKTEGQ